MPYTTAEFKELIGFRKVPPPANCLICCHCDGSQQVCMKYLAYKFSIPGDPLRWVCDMFDPK